MKLTLIILFMLTGLLACQEKKPTQNPVAKPAPFAEDSIRSVTFFGRGSTEAIQQGYSSVAKCYILSDLMSHVLGRLTNQKVQKSIQMVRTRQNAGNQPLAYRIHSNKSHYSKLLVEFYFPLGAALNIGTAKFDVPNKRITLHIDSFVESMKVSDREKRFMKMVYQIQVPDEPNLYKVYFDCPFDEWDIYQPLTDPWLAHEGFKELEE